MEQASSSYRAVFADPIARRLFLGQAASNLGDFVGFGALLVIAFERTGEPLGVGALFAAQAVPAFIATVLAGPWLDRLDRRNGLVAIYLTGASALALPLIGGLWPVLLAAAVIGATRPLAAALRHAMMGDKVSQDALGPLVALQSSIAQASMAAGYFVGAAATVAFGAGWALSFDSLTFVIAAAISVALPRGCGDVGAPPRFSGGIRTVLEHRDVTVIAGLLMLGALVAGVPEVLAVAVAGSGQWLPFVLASNSVGVALGGMSFGHRRAFESPHRLAGLAVGTGIAFIGAGLLVPFGEAAVVVGNLAIGFGFGYMVCGQSAVTRLLPSGRLGHAVSSLIALAMLIEAAGALAASAISSFSGPLVAYIASGSVLTVLALLAVRLRASPGSRRVEQPTLLR